MDRLEGYPRLYDRMLVPATLEDGSMVDAWGYVMNTIAGAGHRQRRLEKQRMRCKMTNTILIEQTAKNIKLVEAIVLTVLFTSIAAGLGGMYLSLALGIAMFILAGIAFLAQSCTNSVTQKSGYFDMPKHILLMRVL